MTRRPTIDCTYYNWWQSPDCYLARLSTNATRRQVSISDVPHAACQGRERAALSMLARPSS